MDKDKREILGCEVRNVWVAFAKEQVDPKPAHLLGWDELDEGNKEVDRRIGERIAALCVGEYSALLTKAEELLSLSTLEDNRSIHNPMWRQWQDRYRIWHRTMVRAVINGALWGKEVLSEEK